MPPPATKKKPAKKKKPPATSSSSTTTAANDEALRQQQYEGMTLPALQEAVIKLKRERKDARIKQDEAKLAQEKSQTLYATTTQTELVKATQTHAKLQKSIEALQFQQRLELRVYNDKMVSLDYQHGRNLARVAEKKEKLLLEVVQEQEQEQEGEKRMDEVKAQHKTRETEEERQHQIEQEQQEEMRRLQQTLDVDLAKLQTHATDSLTELHQQLELRRKVEIHALEERTNQHRYNLAMHHDKNYSELKVYYQNVVEEQVRRLKARQDEILAGKSKAKQDHSELRKLDRGIAHLQRQQQQSSQSQVLLAKTGGKGAAAPAASVGLAPALPAAAPAAAASAPRKGSSVLTLRHAEGRLRFLDKKLQALQEVNAEREKLWKDIEQERGDECGELI